jgi:hypothetical protein
MLSVHRYLNRCEEDRSIAEQAVTFFRESPLLREASLAVRNLASAVLKRFHEVAVTMTSTTQQSFKFEKLLCCFLRLFETTLKHRHALNEAMGHAIATCNEVVESIDNMKTLLVENTAYLGTADNALTTKLDEVLLAAAAVAEAEHEEVEVKDDEELLSAFVIEQSMRIAGVDTADRHIPHRDHHDSEHLTAVQREADQAATVNSVTQTREELLMWQSKITARRTDALRALKEPNAQVRLVIDMIAIVLSKQLDPTVTHQTTKLCDSWSVTQDVITQPNFHILIQSYTTTHFTSEMLELLEPYLNLPELTSASVRETAKDVAVFYEWICLLAAHHRAVQKTTRLARMSLRSRNSVESRDATQASAKTVAPTVISAATARKTELIVVLGALQAQFDENVRVKQVGCTNLSVNAVPYHAPTTGVNFDCKPHSSCAHSFAGAGKDT